jgi:hypothetical protein
MVPCAHIDSVFLLPTRGCCWCYLCPDDDGGDSCGMDRAGPRGKRSRRPGGAGDDDTQPRVRLHTLRLDQRCLGLEPLSAAAIAIRPPPDALGSNVRAAAAAAGGGSAAAGAVALTSIGADAAPSGERVAPLTVRVRFCVAETGL